jgi:hypothetical protein
VGAVGFAIVCNQPGSQIFTVSFESLTEMRCNSTEQLSSESTPDPNLSKIPLEYHEFAEVFSEQEADQLPLYRPYDYIILTVPNTAPHLKLIRSMSLPELDTLRSYIKTNLRRKFI